MVQTLIRLLLPTEYSLVAFAHMTKIKCIKEKHKHAGSMVRSVISTLFSLKCQMQVYSESMLFIYGAINDLVNQSMRPENRSEFKSHTKFLHSVCKQQLPSNGLRVKFVLFQNMYSEYLQQILSF